MSDEIKKQATAILAQLLKMTKSGIDALPSLAEELIFYKRVELTLELILLLGACGLAVYGFRRGLEIDKVNDGVPLMAVSGISGVAVGILALLMLSQTIMVWTAPRLFVIEYLRGLV